MKLFKALIYSLIFSFSSLFSDTSGYIITGTDCRFLSNVIDYNTDYLNSAGHIWVLYSESTCLGTDKVYNLQVCEEGYDSNSPLDGTCPHTFICESPNVVEIDSLGIQTCVAPSIPLPENPEDDYDGDGVPNKCDADNPNYNTFDCDGDGITNDTDTDDDNDGIPDISDSDNPLYGQCLGTDSATSPLYFGNRYPISNYHYNTDYIGDFGTTYSSSNGSANTCSLTVGQDWGKGLVDGAYSLPDKNSACVVAYCYHHSETETYGSTNPCEDAYKALDLVCDDLTHEILGFSECTHNGMQVTNDSLKCVDNATSDALDLLKDESDCNKEILASWNSSTNSCDCYDGYTRNSFGNCWSDTSVDENSTNAELEEDKLNQMIDAENKAIAESESNSTSASSVSGSTTNDILTGIRGDINGTNSLLSHANGLLKDILDNNDTVDKLGILEGLLEDIGLSVDSNGTVVPDNTDDEDGLIDFMNNIKSDIESVLTSYESTKSLLSDPFSMVLSNKTCSPFTVNAFGKSVELDLMTPMSIIRPVLTFILTVVMYLLSIQIYIRALGLKNE